MREFRVWCENKKEWEEHKCVLTQKGRLLQINKRGQLIPHFKGHIVEFYTGLKDKNGKKIFEGDIIRFPDHNITTKVYWNVYQWDTDPYTRLSVANKMEIIGNIHEESK